MTVSDEDLKKWRALCYEATAGPWRYFIAEEFCFFLRHDDGQGNERRETEGTSEDEDFICAARDALPRLIDAFGAERAKVKRLEDGIERAWVLLAVAANGGSSDPPWRSGFERWRDEVWHQLVDEARKALAETE